MKKSKSSKWDQHTFHDPNLTAISQSTSHAISHLFQNVSSLSFALLSVQCIAHQNVQSTKFLSATIMVIQHIMDKELLKNKRLVMPKNLLQKKNNKLIMLKMQDTDQEEDVQEEDVQNQNANIAAVEVAIDAREGPSVLLTKELIISQAAEVVATDVGEQDVNIANQLVTQDAITAEVLVVIDATMELETANLAVALAAIHVVLEIAGEQDVAADHVEVLDAILA